MDDWNDFGLQAYDPADRPASPDLPPPLYQPPSQSTIRTSDASIVHYEDDDDDPDGDDDHSNALVSASHTGSRSEPIQERSSILSSIPFLSSQRRRAERNSAPSDVTREINTPLADIQPRHPRMSDRTLDQLHDRMSSASESDAIEPRSVMMSRNTPARDDDERPPTDGEDDDDAIHVKHNHMSRLGNNPKHGDLDDVPDDFELNIDGFRFLSTGKAPNSSSDVNDEPQSSVIASSLLRHSDKSYTKLEVITAKQIRALLIFFNLFILLSLALTLIYVVWGSTERMGFQKIAVPTSLTTPAIRKKSQGPVPYRPPSRRSRSNGDKSTKTLRLKDLSALTKDLFAEQGLYYFGGVFLPGPVRRTANHDLFQFPAPTRQIGFDEAIVRQGNGTGPPVSSPGGAGNPTGSTGGNPSRPPGGNSSAANRPRPAGGFTSGRQEPQLSFYFVWESLILPNKNYPVLAFSVLAVFSCFFSILGVLFAIRLYQAKRCNITHEQFWVLLLLFVASAYFNLFHAVMRLHEISVGGTRSSDSNPFPQWMRDFEPTLFAIIDAAYVVFCYFYLWANMHSFRILDPSTPLTFRSFYLPKLIVLLPLCVYHALGFYILDLTLSEVPILSAPGLAFIYSNYNVWQYLKVEAVFAIMKTLMDILILFLIVREATLTMKVLERAPYMKFRAKRVGFRFFMYINLVFYSLFFLLRCLVIFTLPKGHLLTLAFYQPDRPTVDTLAYMNCGPSVLIVGYVLSTAYVHLPYTCTGWLKGWFVSSSLAEPGSRWTFSSSPETSETHHTSTSVGEPRFKNTTWSQDEETPISLVDNDAELQQQIVEPITYRKRESKDSLELKANCFTMQTHVIMFNFAWYVYYYGTPKLDSFRPKENPLPFEFTVDRHIIERATDTQVLILNCTDRIIITFKGTTSMKNLRTSMQLNQERLSEVIRLNADGEDESGRLKKLFGARYEWGKIHKGFGAAYLSVADEIVSRVRSLRGEKKRPVFLTGHSLGGALATICSLDLWVKLNVSRREIFVSTFGSPRVGNSDFAKVYKEVVPLHWRIVVDPDMIAKLPRVGYVHVGKKVVLTPHGEMIIDPSALEQRPWTGEAAGFAYHRKASYMLAMRAWCVRNHGMTYTPVFWPFPVRPEDERRFAGAFDEEDVPVRQKITSKIIRLDAMVDILGGDDPGLDSNKAAVERWARLTRRALLNDKLTSSAAASAL